MEVNGDFVVVWEDNQIGDTIGTSFEVDTRKAALLNKPEAAMNADGDFIVAYEANDDSLVGTWAHYYFEGSPKGTPIRVNTFSSFTQGLPAVGIDANANAAVVWESNGNAEQDGAGSGIFGQRLSGLFKDDIVIDFGSIGLWARMNDASWLKLHPSLNPDRVAIADMDGNGQDDVIADFSSTVGGIYVKRNLGSWLKLHDASSDSLAISSLDNQ